MALRGDLVAFVKESLRGGLTRPQIEEALIQAGWPPDQVKQALAGFADIDFPVPVPRPVPYVTAREAFLYVVMFGTLFASAFSLGALLWGLLDLAFPVADATAKAAEQAREVIRWSVSWLLVAVPVFLCVTLLIRRDIRAKPTSRASKVRRQLAYVTLFIASCVLIGDVVVLVFNFLGGEEVTTRFILKALVVAAIAGGTFGYFVWDLREAETEPET